MKKRDILIVLLAIISLSSFGQRSRSRSYVVPTLEQLPRHVIDTIATKDPETKVVIFSNNTWEYYRPVVGKRLDKFDVYKYNWDTSSVFSYRNIELVQIPEVVELKLAKKLNEFHPPIVGKVFSKYGPRRRRNHNGVDIPLKMGEPIYATFEGKVRYAKYNSGGFGYLVIVRHPNGLETWMAHLSKLNCEVGDFVKAGQVVGFGGNTGRSRGPHLHFEMRYQDQTFDPEFLIDFEGGELKYLTFALEKQFFNIHSRASELLEEDDYDEVLPESLLATASDEAIMKVAEKQVDQAATSSNKPTYYKVKSGDNLGKIALRNGTTVSNICKLNGIKSTTILQIGKSLRVK